MSSSSFPPSSMTPPLAEVDLSTIPAEEHARKEWLTRILGEAACRQLGIYRIPDDLIISVVIPVYNERDTIREILRRVRAVPIRKQIILVDDCSKDGTRDVLGARSI